MIGGHNVVDYYNYQNPTPRPIYVELCTECFNDEMLHGGTLEPQLNGELRERMEAIRQKKQKAGSWGESEAHKLTYAPGHCIPFERTDEWRKQTRVYATDGGIIRHGELPEDEENFKPSSFCGLCVINPT